MRAAENNKKYEQIAPFATLYEFPSFDKGDSLVFLPTSHETHVSAIIVEVAVQPCSSYPSSWCWICAKTHPKWPTISKWVATRSARFLLGKVHGQRAHSRVSSAHQQGPHFYACVTNGPRRRVGKGICVQVLVAQAVVVVVLLYSGKVCFTEN